MLEFFLKLLNFRLRILGEKAKEKKQNNTGQKKNEIWKKIGCCPHILRENKKENDYIEKKTIV